jgi:hypothetical protein
MIHLPKSAVSFSVVAVAAGILTLAAPRAAHAVAAALVQVTNTSSNPVVTQSTPTMASQLVDLYGQTGYASDPNSPAVAPFYPFLPGGDIVTIGYSVPANQALVITSADVLFYDCQNSSTPGTAALVVNNDSLSHRFWAASSEATAHFTYPTGFALAPGATLGFENNSQCLLAIDMQGYLTSN